MKLSLWENLLDKTIMFSFDRSGFVRHQKNFREDLEKNDLKGKKILVTGGTSGIGKEAASAFARLGAEVFITGRDLQKGLKIERDNPLIKFISLDMADWQALKAYVCGSEDFDCVVLNAGGMPEKMEKNQQGVEVQCASQLIGHFLLIDELRKAGKLKNSARIIWVSSGGMYLKKLDLKSLFDNREYEKVSTYANVKRAQVTLVEELAKMAEWKNYGLYVMHPGWVATHGLENSLPGFFKLMKSRLRDARMGADTILWLAMTTEQLSSGTFYFDRQQVSPYLNKAYDPSLNERKDLLKNVRDYLS